MKHMIELTNNLQGQLENSDKASLIGKFGQVIVDLNYAVLKSYNHCFEIAAYIDELVRSHGPLAFLPQVLGYTSDKDRLELELRKSLLTRLIDFPRFNGETEKNLVNEIAKQFGGRLFHKASMILQEK